jgi:hypothetical protein
MLQNFLIGQTNLNEFINILCILIELVSRVDDWSVCPLHQMYVIITVFAVAACQASIKLRTYLYPVYPTHTLVQQGIQPARVDRLITDADVFNHNAIRICRHVALFA